MKTILYYFLEFRWLAVLIIAVSALAGCVAVPPPEPTISRLSPNTKYFIQSIDVVTNPSVKSETISDNIKNALKNIPSTAKPAGTPVKLQIVVTKLHDVTPAEALWIGGINSINGTFMLMQPRDEKILHSIELQANSANYAPGGIIGMIAEASSDDEPKLANALSQQFRFSVLDKQDLIMQAGAINYTSEPLAGKEQMLEASKPPATNEQTLAASTPKQAEVVAASIKTVRRPMKKGFRRLNTTEIKVLFQDTFIENYPNHWQINFSPDGTWEGLQSNWSVIEGYGTWTAEKGMHCRRVTDISSTWSNVETEACYQVWVDEDAAKIRMIDPSVVSRWVLAKENAYGDIDRMIKSTQ